MINVIVGLPKTDDHFRCGDLWVTDEDVFIVAAPGNDFKDGILVSLINGKNTTMKALQFKNGPASLGLRRLTGGTVTLKAGE